MNNIAQSNPEGELERLSGTRRPRELDAPDERNEEKKNSGAIKKKGKKWPVVIVLLVILVAAGVGGVLWVMRMMDDSGYGLGAGGLEYAEIEEVTGDEAPVVGDKPSELTLESELVQKLYGYFDVKKLGSNIMTPFEPLGKFYPDTVLLAMNVTLPQKVVIALQNLDDYAGEYSGEEVRAKIKEIFGDAAVDFKTMNADNATVIVGGEGWKYDAQKDKFVNVVSGATIRPISRALLAVEQDGDKLELYDIAGYVGCWTTQQIMEQEVCLSAKLDGTEIAGSEKVTAENMKEFAGLFDKYRWTFAKNAEGDYVFKKLEKIE